MVLVVLVSDWLLVPFSLSCRFFWFLLASARLCRRLSCFSSKFLHSSARSLSFFSSLQREKNEGAKSWVSVYYFKKDERLKTQQEIVIDLHSFLFWTSELSHILKEQFTSSSLVLACLLTNCHVPVLAASMCHNDLYLYCMLYW